MSCSLNAFETACNLVKYEVLKLLRCTRYRNTRILKKMLIPENDIYHAGMCNVVMLATMFVQERSCKCAASSLELLK